MKTINEMKNESFVNKFNFVKEILDGIGWDEYDIQLDTIDSIPVIKMVITKEGYSRKGKQNNCSS